MKPQRSPVTTMTTMYLQRRPKLGKDEKERRTQRLGEKERERER